MKKFKFRGLVSFLLFFSFLLSLVSGIVLYFPPQGKIAHWTHWMFWGLDKELWGALHINASLVFFLVAGFHLYYNWKVLVRYAKQRAVMALHLKWELFTALAFSGFILVATLYNIEPFRTVIRWNNTIKAHWAAQAQAQPPIPHAEELTAVEFCEQLNLSVEFFQQAVQRRGWKMAGAEETIQEIARRNGVSPAQIFAALNQAEQGRGGQGAGGWGRKTVQQICAEKDIEIKAALQRLAAHGIQASQESLIRTIAAEAGLSPSAVVNLITGGHRASSNS